eukprot:2001428-Rhodomonas_salina.2
MAAPKSIHMATMGSAKVRAPTPAHGSRSTDAAHRGPGGLLACGGSVATPKCCSIQVQMCDGGGWTCEMAGADGAGAWGGAGACLLYTSDAADDMQCVDLG